MIYSIKDFIYELIKYFKKQVSITLQELAISKFTLVNIQKGKTLHRFVQEIIYNARATKMTAIYNQLLSVQNSLDMPLQMQISLLETSTMLLQFLKEIDHKEPVLYNMAHRNQHDCKPYQDY